METNSSVSEDDTFEASKQIFRVQGHIDQHCVLLISNLHYDVTEMEEHFRVAVPIRSLTIFYDGNGISTGKGEIVLYNEEDASTLEVRFGHTKLKIMRLESPGKRILDMFFNSILISNLPEGVTANELKAHFPPAIKARNATINYNKDGSWTGRGKVIFYDNVHDGGHQKMCWLNEHIRGQRMDFVKPSPIGFRSYLREITTLYITDLRHDIPADDLKQCFGAGLHINHATIFYNKDGNSTGTGEVTFYRQEAGLASRSSSPSSRSSSSSSSSRRSASPLRTSQGRRLGFAACQ